MNHNLSHFYLKMSILQSHRYASSKVLLNPLESTSNKLMKDMTAPALICRDSFFTSNLALNSECEEDPQTELLRGFPVAVKAPCILSCSLLLLPAQLCSS